MCPAKSAPYTVNDTFSCGRCRGCTYCQYVKSWSFCNGLGDEAFNLVSTYAEHCQPCFTICQPGQYITNLCNGRTMVNTETCANCSVCPFGYYHAKNLTGYIHPDYDGKAWSLGYTEVSTRVVMNSCLRDALGLQRQTHTRIHTHIHAHTHIRAYTH